jgi:hypothetical protein
MGAATRLNCQINGLCIYSRLQPNLWRPEEADVVVVVVVVVVAAAAVAVVVVAVVVAAGTVDGLFT